jgi:hypothetical protein
VVARQWFAAGAAVVLAAIACNTAVISAAAATASGSAGVRFTGKIACSELTGGRITFNPPLTQSGTSTDVETLTGTAAGCTGDTSELGLTIKDGKLKITIPVDTSDCHALTGGLAGPISGVVRWQDTAGSTTDIAVTRLSPNSMTISVNSTDQFIYAMPSSTGTVSESGSFGAGTVTTGTGIGYHTAGTVNHLDAACDSAGGLASARIGARSVPQHCANLQVFFCLNE